MNVLYVAPDVPVPHTGKFLGGSTHVLRISESLAKRGHTVYIIARRMKNQKYSEQVTKNISVKRINRGILFCLEGSSSWNRHNSSTGWFEDVYFKFYSLFLLVYLLLFMFTKKIDVVVERNSAKGSGVLSAKFFGIPAILEIIDPEVSNIQLKLADRVLAYTKKIISPEYLHRISLTDAGVEADIFKPDRKGAQEIRKRFGLNGRKVVVYVGELSAWHGAEIIIEIADRMRDVTFLMLGKNLQLLSEEVMRKKLGNVIFAGFVDHSEVRKYISTGDVAIAPYRKLTDAFYFSPIKIFEYMACGVPFVASDIEIIREIVEKHQCGLLAEQNDIEDFTVKLNLLMENSRLREKLGKNGRRAAVKHYSWSRVAEKMLQSFE